MICKKISNKSTGSKLKFVGSIIKFKVRKKFRKFNKVKTKLEIKITSDYISIQFSKKELISKLIFINNTIIYFANKLKIYLKNNYYIYYSTQQFLYFCVSYLIINLYFLKSFLLYRITFFY